MLIQGSIINVASLLGFLWQNKNKNSTKKPKQTFKTLFLKVFFLIKILLFVIILSRQQLDVVRLRYPTVKLILGCTLLRLYVLLPSAPLLFYTPVSISSTNVSVCGNNKLTNSFDVSKLTKIPSPYENNWFFKDSGAKLKKLVPSWHFPHRS